MKKAAVLFTIVILLFNTMGHFIVFKSMQLAVRHEIKTRIKGNVPASELTVIRVSDSDDETGNRIDWIEGNEFRLDGRMYDVVRTEHSGDTTIYHCINDVQEETLFANLDKQVKQHNQDDQQTGQKRTNLIKVLVHDAITTNSDIEKPGILLSKDKVDITFRLCGIEFSPPSPPPRS